MKPLIIYHNDCPDGYTAAWWLGRAIGEHDKHPANYGDQPPSVHLNGGEPRDVWIVDFCYPPDDLAWIGNNSRSLTVFDHHETADGWLRSTQGMTVFDNMHHYCDVSELGALDRMAAVLDRAHSGAGLVAQYVKRTFGLTPPPFLFHIEDRDLWQNRMPGTPEVFAFVTSHDYNDEAYDLLGFAMVHDMVSAGRHIVRYRNQLIEQIVDTAYETMIGGEVVWLAAAPRSVGSDVAGVLADRKPHLFGATYVDFGGGNVRFSLRSTPGGMNVAELAAEHWCGGGHRHAAGFGITNWDDLAKQPEIH